MGDVLTMEQRTDAWFAARIGKATASRVSDIIARTKSGYSALRANYRAQLVCERLTGAREEGFTNAAMLWGTDHEDEARANYSFMTGNDVQEVGFVDHAAIPLTGASPDGLIGDDGMLEIKCPNTATHIETLLNDAVSDKYVVQMQWQMACSGRQWCDFVSFDPRMPEEMRLYVRRFPRDAGRIAELEREVSAFIAEVDEICSQLNARFVTIAGDAPNMLRAG